MPFKKHHCTLGLGSDSMLPAESGVMTRLFRKFKKLCQISQYHPETYNRFYSYPEVMAERQRHLYEGGNFLIHPYSLYSLTWISIMTIVNVAHMCCSTFRLSYIIMPLKDLKPHYVDAIILGLNVVCWMDIIVKFNTGYVLGVKTIVLDRALITWLVETFISDIATLALAPQCFWIPKQELFWNRRYLTRWFLIDLISTMPIALIILQWYPHKPRHLLVAHFLPLLRCARIYTVVVDLKIILETCTKSYIWHGSVRQALVFLVTCHWCGCVLYLPPVISLYWYGVNPLKYTNFLDKDRSIMDYSTTDRYKKSIFLSLSAFFGTGFSMFVASEHDEILLHALVITYSEIFMVYNFVFLLKIYLTIYSSTIRYHEMMNEVEEYMRQKQFPLPLKKRVRAFYYYRYHERYFNEDNVLHSLSEGLRNEITLHTCSKLVDKVALFHGVPPDVMGSILGSLHPEVYLPNESVVRAGELGNCMFFIANGTVAVYSLKGAEVCHLEDGAHFGEVALLMKDSKRVATVIAVEITLLYRLDDEDFKQFIMKNEMLYERVEALASLRMHEILIVDEDLLHERAKEPHEDEPTSNFTTVPTLDS